MGYNSSLFILNDAWHLAHENPKDFVQAVASNVINLGSVDRFHYLDSQVDAIGHTAKSFGFKNHANPFAAMTCEHADWHELLLVGGNYATVIGKTYAGNRGHHTREDVKRDLNAILAEYNMKVVDIE